MAIITVELNETDIRDACMYWATSRILNEVRAINCDLEVTVYQGKPTGTINRITVNVETDRMKKEADHG